MKTVIALSGVANRGKTETIRNVYNQLYNEYPDAQQQLLVSRSDVRVILTIEGVKVGIESQGDPNSRLPKSLALFQREGCQIVVCTMRTYGMTVEAVEQLRIKHGYNLTKFDQLDVPSPQRKHYNAEMALKIVAEVKKALH